MDFQEMFFSFDGRLNRKPYILRFLLRNAIIWCLGYLIGSLFAPDGTMFQILAFALTLSPRSVACRCTSDVCMTLTTARSWYFWPSFR